MQNGASNSKKVDIISLDSDDDDDISFVSSTKFNRASKKPSNGEIEVLETPRPAAPRDSSIGKKRKFLPSPLPSPSSSPSAIDSSSSSSALLSRKKSKSNDFDSLLTNGNSDVESDHESSAQKNGESELGSLPRVGTPQSSSSSSSGASQETPRPASPTTNFSVSSLSVAHAARIAREASAVVDEVNISDAESETDDELPTLKKILSGVEEEPGSVSFAQSNSSSSSSTRTSNSADKLPPTNSHALPSPSSSSSSSGFKVPIAPKRNSPPQMSVSSSLSGSCSSVVSNSSKDADSSSQLKRALAESAERRKQQKRQKVLFVCVINFISAA